MTLRISPLFALLLLGGAGQALASTPDGAERGKDEATVQYLDTTHMSIRWPVANSKGVQAAKFVQVQIGDVVNPRRYTLGFEVTYQGASGTKVPLGGFSLYPADNPGQFIVPTQGKVKGGGVIVLSLVTPDAMDSDAPLRVAVRLIALTSAEIPL